MQHFLPVQVEVLPITKLSGESSYVKSCPSNSFDVTSLEASLMAQRLKCLPSMWETWVQSLGWEDPLEKEMATHSSILAWGIPWMEEPGGSQRVRQDWAISLSLFSGGSRPSCAGVGWGGVGGGLFSLQNPILNCRISLPTQNHLLSLHSAPHCDLKLHGMFCWYFKWRHLCRHLCFNQIFIQWFTLKTKHCTSNSPRDNCNIIVFTGAAKLTEF